MCWQSSVGGCVPARDASSPRCHEVATRHVVQPLELLVALVPEKRLVDLVVKPDVGDVLAVVGRRVPARDARAGLCHEVAARHVVQPLELVVALVPEERLVDFVVRPNVGDVLAVVCRRVPARDAPNRPRR